MPDTIPTTDRFLRRPDVERMTSLSTSALYRLMKLGQFPRPRKIGAGGQNGAVAWFESEVREWMSGRPVYDGDKPAAELKDF